MNEPFSWLRMSSSFQGPRSRTSRGPCPPIICKMGQNILKCCKFDCLLPTHIHQFWNGPLNVKNASRSQEFGQNPRNCENFCMQKFLHLYCEKIINLSLKKIKKYILIKSYFCFLSESWFILASVLLKISFHWDMYTFFL